MKYSVAIVFTWIGFICAISFMEAWLKFMAPGVTLQLGLGIGKLVFFALNKVELLFCLVLLIIHIKTKQQLKPLLAIVFFALLIQTFWLLPALDARATQIIAKQTVSKSYLHIIYVLLEILKVTCLILHGIKQKTI